MKQVLIAVMLLPLLSFADDRIDCNTLRDSSHTRVCFFAPSGRVNVERIDGDHYSSIWYTPEEWLSSPEYRQWKQDFEDLDAAVRANDLRFEKNCKAHPPKDEKAIQKCKAVSDMNAGRAGKRTRQTNVKSEGEAQSWHTQKGCESDGFVWKDEGCHAQP